MVASGTGEDVTAFTREETIRFWNAAGDGNDADVTALLIGARVNVNTTNPQGRSALMMAAIGDHASVVAQLIECETMEVNAVDKVEGVTALVFAAGMCHEAVVAKLVGCDRVDVNLANVKGYTAILSCSSWSSSFLGSQST
jgi:ankyrin repeat protein